MLTLVKSVPDKSKTLTLKLDLDTLAEFAVAAQIKRARSVSSFVHEYVVRQINEARQLVSAEEFTRRVEDQKASILARSSTKQKESKAFLANNPPDRRQEDAVEIVVTDQVVKVQHEELTDDQDQAGARNSRARTKTKIKRNATR